ncbi:hypothetical protein HYT53_02655 [Candidatus Woesearchaeota archaeon]|nr:hypothetical protein [Candidatus Woesearchaeota archaeon]
MTSARFDKNTKKCISIAEKPGTFGVEFHNKGYALLGLNYIYFPLKVSYGELEPVIGLVRRNFHGCSVSMPHKARAAGMVDALDDSAKKTGAVNTILNQNGKLKGYNTDFYGAKTALQKTLSVKNKKVLMLGAGGAARAIGHAVKELGGKLAIANRTKNNGEMLAKALKASLIGWKDIAKEQGYLLVNATSIGMDSKSETAVSKKTVSNFYAVMDVVIPETQLIHEALRQKKIIIPGCKMAVYQAAEQFRIYAGKELPESFIRQALDSFKQQNSTRLK